MEDPGTSGHAPGARVLLCGWGYGTTRDGTWRELATVPPSHLVPIPDDVGDDDAAGLVTGSGYLTARLAPTRTARMRPGQVVLAPGIYGAVANAAAQVAPLLGASRVVSTARGADRLAAVPRADDLAIIDLEQETLSAGVARLTDGAGVDIVLDGLGGDLTGQALGTLRRGGVLVSIGYIAGTKAAIDVTDLIWKTARMEGFLFTAFTQQEVADTYCTLLGHLSVRAIKPAIDGVYPLDQGRRGPETRRRGPSSRESVPRSPHLSPPRGPRL